MRRMRRGTMAQPRAQAGFSLVELMIALVITLIVSGAIFGLLTGGQSAFRVQPERTDGHQHIRRAMDLIMRDIATAGDGSPAFIQTFTPGLNAIGPPGPEGPNPDQLEIFGNPGSFAPEPACNYDGSNASHIRLPRNVTLVPENSVVLIAMTNGTWTMRYINGGISNPNNGDGS